MFTWDQLEEIPGLVDLDLLQPYNDAVIASRHPWQIQFPAQQWAYGALIPVQPPPGWPPERHAVVRLDLEVLDGRLGVAGVGVEGHVDDRGTPRPGGL